MSKNNWRGEEPRRTRWTICDGEDNFLSGSKARKRVYLETIYTVVMCKGTYKMEKMPATITLMIGILLSYFGSGISVAYAGTYTPVHAMKEFDVPYDFTHDATQTSKLDIYYVPDDKPKRLLVFIHGGSWVHGNKNHLRTADPFIQWFLKRGFVVAAPNFRLATPPGELQKVTYKEQATDIARALSWLNNHRSKYGIIEKEVFLLGFSSGAHLVPLIATDTSYLKSVGLTPDYIKATISLDVHTYDVPYALQLMKGSVVDRNIPLIKFLFGNSKKEQRLASPAFYVSKSFVPPSLIISAEPSLTIGSHGYITSQASKRYVKLLTNLGHQATWRHFDHKTHVSLVLGFGIEGDEPTEELAKFLDSL